MRADNLKELVTKLQVSSSSLERKFLEFWFLYSDSSLPLPTPQYNFSKKHRYKIDFAWVDDRLGVELQGIGGGGHGRPVTCHNCRARVRALKKDGSPGKFLSIPYSSHGSASKMNRDAEKFNLMVMMGWRPIIITSGMLADNPRSIIKLVEMALKLER